VYEPVGEARNPIFFVKCAPLDEPWFYRVTAFNARGSGGCKLVWLYRRPMRGKPLIVPVVVVPGLCVTVCEWEHEPMPLPCRSSRRSNLLSARHAVC
jgi:hypothetical protein